MFWAEPTQIPKTDTFEFHNVYLGSVQDTKQWPNRVIWNSSHLVIQYPISFYRSSETVISIHRQYISPKGFFTAQDIIQRFEAFYHSPFSELEYNCIIKQLDREFNRKASKTDFSKNFCERRFHSGDNIGHRCIDITDPKEFYHLALVNPLSDDVQTSPNPDEEHYMRNLEAGKINKINTIPNSLQGLGHLLFYYRPGEPNLVIMTTYLESKFLLDQQGIYYMGSTYIVNPAHFNQF